MMTTEALNPNEAELSGLVSQRQREILRHALGLIGGRKGHRNHYVTTEGSMDYPDLEALVSLGMMTRHDRDWVPGYIYMATEKGKAAACAG